MPQRDSNISQDDFIPKHICIGREFLFYTLLYFHTHVEYIQVVVRFLNNLELIQALKFVRIKVLNLFRTIYIYIYIYIEAI